MAIALLTLGSVDRESEKLCIGGLLWESHHLDRHSKSGSQQCSPSLDVNYIRCDYHATGWSVVRSSSVFLGTDSSSIFALLLA